MLNYEESSKIVPSSLDYASPRKMAVVVRSAVGHARSQGYEGDRGDVRDPTWPEDEPSNWIATTVGGAAARGSHCSARRRVEASTRQPDIERPSLLRRARYEMRRQCQEIIPSILLGPFVVSKSLQTLQELGITHMCATPFRDFSATVTLVSVFAFVTSRRLSLSKRGFLPTLPILNWMWKITRIRIL